MKLLVVDDVGSNIEALDRESSPTAKTPSFESYKELLDIRHLKVLAVIAAVKRWLLSSPTLERVEKQLFGCCSACFSDSLLELKNCFN